jgi:hypothetical protein
MVMMKMRRLYCALAVLFIALAAFVTAPAVAMASPASIHAVAPATCLPGVYPPPQQATIMSSTTTPFIGQKIEASGINYCPDEDVRLTIAGTFVGTAHTDFSGSFDPQVTVPGPVGDKELCGVGASGLPTDQDCLTLHVKAESNGPGGPAFTGVQIAALVLVAVALLAGGGFFAAAGRRKSTTRV